MFVFSFGEESKGGDEEVDGGGGVVHDEVGVVVVDNFIHLVE